MNYTFSHNWLLNTLYCVLQLCTITPITTMYYYYYYYVLLLCTIIMYYYHDWLLYTAFCVHVILFCKYTLLYITGEMFERSMNVFLMGILQNYVVQKGWYVVRYCFVKKARAKMSKSSVFVWEKNKNSNHTFYKINSCCVIREHCLTRRSYNPASPPT